jgi:hypothetical protein
MKASGVGGNIQLQNLRAEAQRRSALAAREAPARSSAETESSLDDSSPVRGQERWRGGERQPRDVFDDTLGEIIDGWEGRNPWATAQRLLDVAQDQRALPDDQQRSLARAIQLHARLCEQERMQDVVQQGLR